MYMCAGPAGHDDPLPVPVRAGRPLKIHWTVPVKSTGQVTILWTMQLTSETPLENVTEGRVGRRLTHGTTTQQSHQTFNFCKLVTWF